MKQKTIRVNMNIAEPILAKIDQHAEEMGLNRSATITMIASTYFHEREAITGMNKAIKIMQNEQA